MGRGGLRLSRVSSVEERPCCGAARAREWAPLWSHLQRVWKTT